MILHYPPSHRQNLAALRADARNGALLRSLGLYGYFGTTYYAQLGSRAVALR